MTKEIGYFDEIGFFESLCTDFHWNKNDLIVNFSRGIDIGGSKSIHPLKGSLSYDEPCELTFVNVGESRLVIKEYLGPPNKFQEHTIVNSIDGRLEKNKYAIEGTMTNFEILGWFTWIIYADEIILDDLKSS